MKGAGRQGSGGRCHRSYENRGLICQEPWGSSTPRTADASAATPSDVIKRLNEALRAATRSDAMREYYQRSGSEPGTMSSDEFTAFIRRDALDAAKIVSDLKIEKQ